MERVEVLKALRASPPKFPHGWHDTEAVRARQGKVIRWCLVTDPNLRAGAADLLRSDLLPAAPMDDTVVEAIALLSTLKRKMLERSSILTILLAAQRDSPYVHNLMSVLFNRQSSNNYLDELAFDEESQSDVDSHPSDAIVRYQLEAIFRMRGAVDFAPPLLMPASDSFAPSSSTLSKPAILLDRRGVPVQSVSMVSDIFDFF